jgi:hypothetical protein
MRKIKYSLQSNQKWFATIGAIIIILILVLITPFSTGINFITISSAGSYSLVRQWGSFGSDKGQFHLPWSLDLNHRITLVY